MSHFTEVKTQIKNKDILQKTLKKLGYTLEEATEGVTVRGFMGNTLKGEFKALTDTHYDIGFIRNSEGNYELVADWELMPKVAGIEQTEFTNLVKREYARNSVLEMAQAQGMQVETVEQNGNIEMVVSQW